MSKFVEMSNYPEEIILLLERTHYEVESRESVIKLILQNNLLEYYTEYWEDYLLHLKAYDNLQKAFWDQYLPECTNKGILDFDSRRIIIL